MMERTAFTHIIIIQRNSLPGNFHFSLKMTAERITFNTKGIILCTIGSPYLLNNLGIKFISAVNGEARKRLF